MKECIRWTPDCAYYSDAPDDDVRYVVNMHSLYKVEVYATCEFTLKASAEPAVTCSRHQTDPEQDPEAGHGEYTTQPAVQGEPPAIPDYLLST